MRMLLGALAAACLTVSAGASEPKAASTPDAGWGTIKGKVVWAKSEAPPQKKANVDPNNADAKFCLQHGDLPDEEVVVDPKTMAVANVFVYLRKVDEADIHPSYPKTAEDVAKKDVEEFKKLSGVTFDELQDALKAGKVDVDKLKAPAMIDQRNCRYIPHALAVRSGQTVLVKNPEAVSHNVNFQGFEDANRENLNMAPKSLVTKKLAPETSIVNVGCNIHGWMKMGVLVLDHPYVAVTGPDGTFELKNVKPGEHVVVVRNSNGQFIRRNDLKVEVAADEVKDVGEVKWSK
jgi:plastocyanin